MQTDKKDDKKNSKFNNKINEKKNKKSSTNVSFNFFNTNSNFNVNFSFNLSSCMNILKYTFCDNIDHQVIKYQFKNWNKQNQEFKDKFQSFYNWLQQKNSQVTVRNNETAINFPSSVKGLTVMTADSNWYLNTGASFHITNKWSLLHHTRMSEGEEVSAAQEVNKNILISKLVDKLTVSMNGQILQLQAVCWMTETSCNLVSFNQLVTDRFNIKTLWDNENIIVGFEIVDSTSECFYAMISDMKVFSIYEIKKAALIAMSKSITSMYDDILFIWHVKLSHLNTEDVLQLMKDLKINIQIKSGKELSFCETCKLAKAHKKILQISILRVKVHNQRLHFDLVGEGESFEDIDNFLSSFQELKYLLLVMNDATHYKTFYFLKTKDQLLDFVNFHLQQLLNKSIKMTTAHSDSVQKIYNQKTQAILIKFEVIWESTELYTSY